MAFFGINFGNTPAEIKKLPIQEPGQIAGINQLFEQGLQNANPDIQEKYYRQQFSQQLPGIAERLNMFSGGQQRGQAANYQLGALQSNLESQLAGQRYQAGLRQLQLGLTPQNEYLYQPEKAGFGEELARNAVGSLAGAIPSLATKGAEALGNKLFGPSGDRGQVAQQLANQTGAQIGASATEQALAGLAPAAPKTAADLVAPSTGNVAVDAFQSPSLTPFTRQALAKTQIQAPSPVASALKQGAQSAAAGAAGTAAGAGIKSALGALGGAGATAAAATAPAWLPVALALGVPAAIAGFGYLGVLGYDWYQDRQRRKAEELSSNRRNV